MQTDDPSQRTHDDSSPAPGLPPEDDTLRTAEPPVEAAGEEDLEDVESWDRAVIPGDKLSDDATGEAETPPPAVAAVTSDKHEADDIGEVIDGPVSVTEVPSDSDAFDWHEETSTHRIVIELKRIESEVRGILEERDSKRKRKLGGSRRWLELEEDIIQWRYTGRFDEPTLERLQDLVVKRHYLSRRLRFLAGTRPTWNT